MSANHTFANTTEPKPLPPIETCRVNYDTTLYNSIDEIGESFVSSWTRALYRAGAYAFWIQKAQNKVALKYRGRKYKG